jgi:hypothetical protein
MSQHRAARGGDIDRDTSAAARDPQHRPVLLYVASTPRVTAHRPASLLVTMSASLAMVALLTLTLVSAWRGWQVAWSDSGMPPPSAAPVVPEVPRVDTGTPVAPTLPAAPVGSVPSGTPRAEDPQGAGGQVLADGPGQPTVVAAMVTTAVPGGGAPVRRRPDPVAVPAPATPTRAHTAAADPASVGATDATATQATPSTAVAPARAAATPTAAATSTAVAPARAAATSKAAATSRAAATSSPGSATARSKDACPAPRVPDRPFPAAATRRSSDHRERGLDDARLEEPEHDEPPGG